MVLFYKGNLLGMQFGYFAGVLVLLGSNFFFQVFICGMFLSWYDL